MAAWMWTAAPIDLRGYTQGTLYFDYFLNSQNGPDGLWVMVNTDGVNSKGLFWTGDYRVPNRGLLNLANVPGLGNVCGSATVRIAFCFVSDGSVTAEGAYVDNVRVVCGNGPAVAGITPSTASAGTGTNVTVTGSGFGTSPGAVEFFYQDKEPLIRAPLVTWSDAADRLCRPGRHDQRLRRVGRVRTGARGGRGRHGEQRGRVLRDLRHGRHALADDARTYFRVNAPSTAFQAATLAAADEWNKVRLAVPLRVRRAPARPSSHRGLDSHNDIFWASLGDPDVIGCAWPFFRKGRLVEADICMNTDYAWGDGSGGTMDVQTNVLHELGHWLDLRDVYGDWDAHKAMYGFGDVGFLTRTPCSCDVSGHPLALQRRAAGQGAAAHGRLSLVRAQRRPHQDLFQDQGRGAVDRLGDGAHPSSATATGGSQASCTCAIRASRPTVSATGWSHAARCRAASTGSGSRRRTSTATPRAGSRPNLLIMR